MDKVISVMNTNKAWKGVDLNENPELTPAMEKGRQLREDFLQLYEQGIGALQGGPKVIESWGNRVRMITAMQLYTDQRRLARMIVDIECSWKAKREICRKVPSKN